MSVELSEALAKAVKAAAPSVVRVEARGGRPGSGVVWSNDTVVTVARAAMRTDEAEIALEGGRTVRASVVARDPSIDLCVLKAEASDLVAATWGDSDALAVGHLVLTLGRPGYGVRAALGIVGGLGREWQTQGGAKVDRYVDVDGTLPPGFPGGPLVGVDGRFLGVNSRSLVRGGTTIPASTVKRVVEHLLAHGSAKKPYLGIATHPVDLGDALAAKAGQTTGLVLLSVEPGGPADQAGLVLGDVLLDVGGPVATVDDLLSRLRQLGADAQTKARFLRGGDVREVALTIGSRPLGRVS